MRAEEAYGPVTPGRPVYIFGGEKDHNGQTFYKNTNRYFTEIGMDVDFESNPNYHHWFKDTVAGDIGKFCYGKMQENKETSSNTTGKNEYSIEDKSFLKKGYLHKWDQEQFVNEI